MAGAPNPIWLGDLIRTIDRLEVRSPETIEEIKRLLGMEGVVLPVRGAEDRPSLLQHMNPEPKEVANRPRKPPREIAPFPPAAVIPTGDAIRDNGKEALGRDADVLPAPTRWSPGLPPAPLVPERRVAPFIHDLAATDRWDGPLDVAKIVAAIASGKPLRTLPCRSRKTLRCGIWVVEDWSAAMLPFLRDVARLRSQLDDALGRGGVFVRSAGPPVWSAAVGSEDGSDGEDGGGASRPPPAGVPVLIIGGPGGPVPRGMFEPAHGWTGFVNDLHRRSCPVVILSPFVEQGRQTCMLRIVPWRESLSPAIPPVRVDVSPPPKDGPDAPAAAALERLWRNDRHAYQLAALIALASRIEPRIIRAMRRRYLPNATPLTEARVWASGIVDAAVPEAFELVPAARVLLLERLGRRRGLLKDVWSFLATLREGGYPETLRLEEELHFRSVARRKEDRAWIHDTLNRVRTTLASRDRSGLPVWAARVLTQVAVPEELVDTRTEVLDAARKRLGAGNHEASASAKTWLELFRKGTTIRIHRRSGPPEEPVDNVIAVPEVQVVSLEVRDGQLGARRRKRRIVVADRDVMFSVIGDPVHVVAEDGATWRIKGQAWEFDTMMLSYFQRDSDRAKALMNRLAERGITLRSRALQPEKHNFYEIFRGEDQVSHVIYLSGSTIGQWNQWADWEFFKKISATILAFGVFKDEMEARGLRWIDITLPATGLAKLIAVMTGTWPFSDTSSEAQDLATDQTVPPLGRPELATVHGRIQDVRRPAFLPPVQAILDRLRPSAQDKTTGWRQPLAVHCSDIQERADIAKSIIRRRRVRRWYPDGIFYLHTNGWNLPAGSSVVILSRLGYQSHFDDLGEATARCREVLRDSRCLVIYGHLLAPFRADELTLTGPLGQTLVLSEKRFGDIAPQQWIDIPRWPAVRLVHAPLDMRRAARLGDLFQKIGLAVHIEPMPGVPPSAQGWDDPAVLVLLTETTEPDQVWLPVLQQSATRVEVTALVDGWPAERPLPFATDHMVDIRAGGTQWAKDIRDRIHSRAQKFNSV